MNTPYFSRREILTFLLSDDAARIEAESEKECWHACWESFFPKAEGISLGDAYYEYIEACLLFGYGPCPTTKGTWVMHNLNVKRA